MTARKTVPFKNWNGVGDAVQFAAKVTGVEAVVKKVEDVTGKSCGCNKRKEALNKAFPFGKDKQDELRTDQD